MAVGRSRVVPGGQGCPDRTSGGVPRPVIWIDCHACQSAGAAEGVVGSMETIMQNVPWNKGRLTGQKRPLKPKDVWAIRVRLQLEHRARDLALFNLAIDSKLRGCDLVRLQVDDFAPAAGCETAPRLYRRRPAGRSSSRSPSRPEPRSETGFLKSRRYLFPSRFRAQPHLSTRQYARIVHAWVESAGLESSAYGTHSMRRTKAAQIYKKTGNLRAVQLLLGHTKLESTVRYLGVEVDDALSISEQVEL